MAKKKKHKKELGELEHYSIIPTIEKNPDCKYYLVIGERTNGKTFSSLEYCVDNFIQKGEEFAYVRRFNVDVKASKMKKLFGNLEEHNKISELSNGEFNIVEYKSGGFYLGTVNEEGEMETFPFIMGHVFDLPSMEHFKSLSYPKVTTIIFDEFISRVGYVEGEFVLFMNTISTIVRERANVKIIMLGNTVNQYCPYFNEMGLKHLSKQKPGTIDIYEYGDSGLKVLVERTDTAQKNGGKPSDVYFAFDNPRLKMITQGGWEIAVYPHLKERYKSTEVVFTFFVEFDGEIEQGQIVATETDMFLYFHRKTTPIKDRDTDFIYTTSPEQRYNVKAGLLGHSDRLSRAIVGLINENHVYYGTNSDGEVIRNFLEWSRSYNGAKGV